MLKQVLVCQSCHADLTRPVYIKYGFTSGEAPDEAEGLSASEEGTALRHKTRLWGIEEQRMTIQNVVWVRLDDVLDHVQSDNKYVGCCGLYGGPNRLCSCGTIVGSEFSDCGGGFHRFQTIEASAFWMEYIPHNRTREHRRAERIKADKKAFEHYKDDIYNG